MLHLAEVYVQGIKVGASEQELWDMFEEVGRISSLSIVPPTKPGQFTTFGFVEYASVEEAQDAVCQFSDVRWNGRVLTVRLTDKTRKKFGLMPEDEDEILYYDSLYDDKIILEKLHLNQPEEKISARKEDKPACKNCSYSKAFDAKLNGVIKSWEKLTSTVSEMKENQDKQFAELAEEVKRLRETSNEESNRHDVRESGDALLDAYMMGYRHGVGGINDIVLKYC